MTSHTREVGPYRLIARLGSTDFSETFLAKHKEYDTLSVIKKPAVRLETDPEWCERFRQRAQLWLRLDHPNLVHTHSVLENEAVPYLIMEYLPGDSLLTLSKICIKYRYQLTPGAIAQIFYALAKGLTCFHQVKNDDDKPINPVHGGINLYNTFICYDRRAMLMDFCTSKAGGFASVTAFDNHHVQNTENSLDPKTDVFDLGLCIWELATGVSPSKVLSDPSKPTSADHESFSKVLTKKWANFPVKLRSILTTCLEIDPERRFQSAEALRQALSSYLKETEQQKDYNALDYVSKHLLIKRKQIKNALVHSAIEDPHWNDYLLEDQEDKNQPAEKKASQKPSKKQTSHHQEDNKNRVPASRKRRIPAVTLTAAILMLFAVLTATLWPSDKEDHLLPPDRVKITQATTVNELLEESTPPIPSPDPTTSLSADNTDPNTEETGSDKYKNSNMGYLRLKTQPQTSVYLNNQFMGNTPIEDMKLKPGWYKFELINKEADISRIFRVRILKGRVSSHTIIY